MWCVPRTRWGREPRVLAARHAHPLVGRGVRYAPRPALAGHVWRASTVPEGTVQGERYCNARGEILRPLQDQPQRRRSASACSSIKDESPGSKDDQTPS